jgi:DASS family divalent anion:Na+ symporter
MVAFVPATAHYAPATRCASVSAGAPVIGKRGWRDAGSGASVAAVVIAGVAHHENCQPAEHALKALLSCHRSRIARVGSVGLGLAIWFAPVPEGLDARTWHLVAIFVAAIFSVMIDAVPILTAAVLAIALAVLSGTIDPARAWSGFGNGILLLIVLAFLVARAVVKTGLGVRIGHWVVSRFGGSSLGLCYSLFIVDALIAPAFPSNTARSGVLFPLAYSLAAASGATPENGARPRLGVFLMFSGMASLALSSALWLTAMAANPLGVAMAQPYGVTISFGSWLLAASVPTLFAMALLPWLLHRITAPEVDATPEAPAAARVALAAMGPMRRDEMIVIAVFLGMVLLWAAGAVLGIDPVAVAFLGFGILLASGTLTLADIAGEGDVLATFLWFAVLFTLSSVLNELGFMSYLGDRLAGSLHGWSWLAAGVAIVSAYVAIHYFFVSQTAHLLALFGVFLDVGVKLGVPATPLAFMLLFATNHFSTITPQASSCNLLFAGSGMLPQAEIYKLGAITTAFNLAVYLLVGGPWLLWLYGTNA